MERFLKCRQRCSGTITLLLGGHTAATARNGVAAAGVAAARGRVILGRLSFSLAANKATTLRIPLTKAGRKDLKHAKTLRATMTVALKVGHAKPKSYSQTLELTKSKPPTGKQKAKKVP